MPAQTVMPSNNDLRDAREMLISELQEHALVQEDVVLSNGQRSSYYVDAKRAILQRPAFEAVGQLIVDAARRFEAQAVGGLTIGAEPVAFSIFQTEEADDLSIFIVRKERKKHGLQRSIEGPDLSPGTRCLVVDDVVTSGSSTIEAIEKVREAGVEVVGAIAVVDRLAGGSEAIQNILGDAPFEALVTIDDVYPDRPDR